MNIFLSQPMHGLSDIDIMVNRKQAICRLVHYMKNIPAHWPQEWRSSANWRVMENPNTEELPHRLMYLGKDIAALADAQVLYLIRGWKGAKGCRIEHQVATEYGLHIISENDAGGVSYMDPARTFKI